MTTHPYRLTDRGLAMRHAVIRMMKRDGRMRYGSVKALAAHFGVSHSRISNLASQIRRRA